MTQNSHSSVEPPMPTRPAPPDRVMPSFPWRPDSRLRKHADYQRAYKASRKQFSSSMSWFLATRQVAAKGALPSPTATPAGPRVGLTVGKVLGKAHERNRIKRRMREVVRHALGVLPDGVDLILHPKRSAMEMDFGKLQAEVLRIFRQAASQTAGSASGLPPKKPALQSRPLA